MSNKTPTPYGLPQPAFFARVLLHSSALFVVALFPCVTPSFGLLNVTESEAPVDQDGSSKEEAISLQARAQVDRDQPSLTLMAPLRICLRLATSGITLATHSGHRLPNNLLAPLRC